MVRMNYLKCFTWCVFAFSITACSTAKISTLPISSQATHLVRSIAMAREGGLLAEAIGIELANRGYVIIDSSSTSKLLIRLNMDEFEVSTPQGLDKLKAKGIDAYLTIKTAGAYDGQIEGASARATSTHTGRIIAGVSWQNGWGGQAGSIADRQMRKGLSEVAQEISTSLAEVLPLY